MLTIGIIGGSYYTIKEDKVIWKTKFNNSIFQIPNPLGGFIKSLLSSSVLSGTSLLNSVIMPDRTELKTRKDV